MIYKFCIVSDEVDNFKLEIAIDSDDTFLRLRNAILDSSLLTVLVRPLKMVRLNLNLRLLTATLTFTEKKEMTTVTEFLFQHATQQQQSTL